ncbi:MAG: hypothetical protein QE278_13745 [Limnobacter sp.]|nr:hypothetical protein [Limnobacter sp.]
MIQPLKEAQLQHTSLEEAIQRLAHAGSTHAPGDSVGLGIVVGGQVPAVLAARIMALQLTSQPAPVHIYLPKPFHALMEMDVWAPAIRDANDLIQSKSAKFWRSSQQLIVQPLSDQGISTAVFLGSGVGASSWADPTLAKALCQGLDQAMIVQQVDPFLDSALASNLSSPALQAGPQSLARATHAYRSKAPNMLKALVFLSAEAWMGQNPQVSTQLASWLDEQQSTAKRLKLQLDVCRMCFAVPDPLAQRQLNAVAVSVQTCNWADLLGYMAYADLIATDQKELILVAKSMGKVSCNLL